MAAEARVEFLHRALAEEKGASCIVSCVVFVLFCVEGLTARRDGWVDAWDCVGRVWSSTTSLLDIYNP